MLSDKLRPVKSPCTPGYSSYSSVYTITQTLGQEPGTGRLVFSADMMTGVYIYIYILYLMATPSLAIDLSWPCDLAPRSSYFTLIGV